MHRGAHVVDLDRQLHPARAPEHRVGISEREPLASQRVDRQVRESIDGKAADLAELVVHERPDLGRHEVGRFLDGTVGADVAQALGEAHFADRRQVFGEVLATAVVEQHRGSVGEQQQVPRGRAGGEHAHVRRAGGVLDVHRVEDERDLAVHRSHRRTQPLESFRVQAEARGLAGEVVGCWQFHAVMMPRESSRTLQRPA